MMGICARHAKQHELKHKALLFETAEKQKMRALPMQ
jgi:hypothetical protein